MGQPCEQLHRRGERRRPEERKAQTKNIEGQNSLSPEGEKPSRAARKSALRFRRSWEEVALQSQHNTMDRAKDDKRPICAMPETGENHSDEEISRGFPLAMCTSAERNVQIIAKPGAQADVPAAPEILKTIGEEGLAEIDHEMEAQQLSASARDIAVTAEVSINLPGKRVRSEQHKPEIGRAELTAKNGVCQNGTIIRDHAFSDEARENQHQAIEKSISVESAFLLDLGEQMPRPLYRTSNQVREQTDEETIIEERPGSFDPPFVDVHDIGDFLKRVKRNA